MRREMEEMALEMFSCSVQWSISFFRKAVKWQLQSKVTDAPYCHLHFTVLLPQKQACFTLIIFLLGNLGFSGVWSCPWWWRLLDNCLVSCGISICRLHWALHSLILWQENPKATECIFPSCRWPSLNNDSREPWGFASHFHLGATSRSVYWVSGVPLESALSFDT